ncbi:SDR family NAD(P)-dependent oxidoreductase [Pseudomonas farris]
MQACYPHLKASGEGRVINFASLAGVIGLQGYAPYNMAKEAVRALTRSAAREWGADKITVNNVMPVADTWGAAANASAPLTYLAVMITRRGHCAGRAIPRQQGCTTPDGLQPDAGRWPNHRQRTVIVTSNLRAHAHPKPQYMP